MTTGSERPGPAAYKPIAVSGTSKECRECGRVGQRAFAPSGDYGWVCVNERACRERAFRRRWGIGDRYSGLRGHNNARRGA